MAQSRCSFDGPSRLPESPPTIFPERAVEHRLEEVIQSAAGIGVLGPLILISATRVARVLLMQFRLARSVLRRDA